MGDLTSRAWIITKGVLFAVIVLLSGAYIILEDEPSGPLIPRNGR